MKQPNGPQTMIAPGKLPHDIQRAWDKVSAYLDSLPKKVKNEAEAQEEARKDREQEADTIYGNLSERIQFLSQQAEMLFLLSAQDIGLPERLDVTFAHMEDRAREAGKLADQLYEVLTGEAESKEA